MVLAPQGASDPSGKLAAARAAPTLCDYALRPAPRRVVGRSQIRRSDLYPESKEDLKR